MALSLQFARVILGLLCIFFAHCLGRSLARRKKPARGRYGWLSWLLRTAVTAMGVLWREGLDRLAAGVLALAVLAAALGFYDEWRPRRDQDPTRTMFPDE